MTSMAAASALYFSHFSGFIILGRREDGKVNLPRRRSGRTNVYEVVGNMVESASKILDRVPNDGRKIERDGLEKMDVISSLSLPRIIRGGDFVWVGGQKILIASLRSSMCFLARLALMFNRSKISSCVPMHKA